MQKRARANKLCISGFWTLIKALEEHYSIWLWIYMVGLQRPRSSEEALQPKQGMQAAMQQDACWQQTLWHGDAAEWLQNVRVSIVVFKLIKLIKDQQWQRLKKSKTDFQLLWSWVVNKVQILSLENVVAWWKHDSLQLHLQNSHIHPIYFLLVEDAIRKIWGF